MHDDERSIVHLKISCPMLLKNYIIDEIYLTYLYTFVLNIMSWSWTSYVDQPHAFLHVYTKRLETRFPLRHIISWTTNTVKHTLIDQVFLVKTARFWLRSVFACLWTETEPTSVHSHAKNNRLRIYYTHYDTLRIPERTRSSCLFG